MVLYIIQRYQNEAEKSYVSLDEISNMKALTLEDLKLIKESLEYTQHNIENYQSHPSYDDKLKKLSLVNNVAAKIGDLIKEAKNDKSNF